MKPALRWVLAGIVLAGGVLVAWQARQASEAAAGQSLALTQQLEMMDKISLKGKQILEAITFSWYEGYSQALQNVSDLQRASQTNQKAAARYAGIFFALALLVLVFYLASGQRWLLGVLLGLTLTALLTGLLLPVLSLVAYKDFPVLGKTIFQYESRSIPGALSKLWHQGQWAIAGVIVVFTVVIPFVKTLLMAWALRFSDRYGERWLHKMQRGLGYLGKWSMLDVFVVAILVTWFSVRENGSTDAQLQAGVFFFLIYVVLSMVVALLLERLSPVPEGMGAAWPPKNLPREGGS